MKRALVLAVTVIGCRSPGTHYYTLVSAATDKAPPASAELQLDVLPVDVPPDVDRQQLVVREGQGEVTPVETRSWISPLPRELRRAFADDLGRVLGARDIAGVTPAAGVPIFRIKLDVQRFESVLGKHALIEAVSTVRDPANAAPALVCSHRAKEDATGDYAGLAEAHQRALVVIANQVAEEVRAIRAGTPACSK